MHSPEGFTAKIRVVFDFGVTHEYDIYASTEHALAAKAREHCDAISRNGYRDNDGEGTYTHWPVHKITKVQALGVKVPTGYPTRISGT